MIEWWTVTSITFAVAAGLWTVVSGMRGFTPRDSTVLSTAGLAIVLAVQMGIAIVQPLVGNTAVGDSLEFWLYLLTAFAMIVVVVVWALVDRSRYATIGMGMVALAVAVMLVRMSIIWTGA